MLVGRFEASLFSAGPGVLSLASVARPILVELSSCPDAEVRIIEDSGHTGSSTMGTAVLDAITKSDPARSHSRETRSIRSCLAWRAWTSGSAADVHGVDCWGMG